MWLATWHWFDVAITIAIILNSIMLASTDYQIRLEPEYESDWTPIQEQIDLGFSVVFIVEAAVKITAMGFAFHKLSYLREPWNCLDFFIVCVSIVGLLPIEGGADSLKALRTFRILRPLRSINKMPAMRKQIQSMLGAIPGLGRVFFFIIFIFSIFAIFGTNQFLGQQYQFCRATEELLEDEDGKPYWPKLGDDDDGPVLCAEDADCAEAFPGAEIAICGTVYEKAGLDPIEYDGIRDIELIMYGIPGFDSVGQGFLTIFQVLTLESWVYLMYNYSDAGSPAISIIFFVFVVLLGAFFTMNLVLAIIVDSFEQANDKEAGDRDADEAEENAEGEEGEKEAGEAEGGEEKPAPANDLDAPPPKLNIDDKNMDVDPKAAADPQEEYGVNGLAYEEPWFEAESRKRSKNNCLYGCMFDFVTSVSFNFFIFLLIIGNTATLAAYTFDQSDLQTQVLDLFNEFFTWIFFLEMICKIIGLGFSNYRQDSYNVFDAVIVVISLVDWALSRIPGLNAGSALNAFRALRLLRMMKLSKSWKALKSLLRSMANSLKDISNFSVLLFLFMYIFALLGMELFANIALYDEDENLIAGEEAV